MNFDALPVVDVFGEEFQSNPRDFLYEARANTSLGRSKRGLEVLSYELCQALLRDRHLGRDHMDIIRRIGMPPGPAYDFNERMLSSQKGEVRNRLRLSLARHLGPQPAQYMRAAIRKLVTRLIDEAPKNEPVDLLAICNRLPAEVYCFWIDAPREDAAFVSRISDNALTMFRQDPAFTPQIVAGFEALMPYVAARLEEKRRNLGTDLLSQLIREQQAGNLSEIELHDYVGMLLIASTDNTANQMALIIADLLERPEQWGKLVNDPSLIGNAIEEGIRFRSRMVSHSRVVFDEDLKVEDVEIPPGTRVSAVLWAAHLTESLFPNPKELDVTRNVAPGPLTFGGGAYSCLGQHVARIEIHEMLTALVTRFPTVRLHGDPQRHHNPFVAWVSDLHVVLSDGREAS